MTDEQMEKWARAISRVWDAIGADCLVDEDGRPDESATMAREDVFGICTDGPFDNYCGLEDEEIRAFHNRDRSRDPELMKLALPYEIYGW